jgi:uncharacterized protein YuzE
MRLRYDLNIGALYVGLADRPTARTREIDDNTFIDLDEDGDVVGIEVISIAHPWALDDILREYSIPPDEVAQLRAYFQRDDMGTPAVSMDRNAPALA